MSTEKNGVFLVGIGRNRYRKTYKFIGWTYLTPNKTHTTTNMSCRRLPPYPPVALLSPSMGRSVAPTTHGLAASYGPMLGFVCHSSVWNSVFCDPLFLWYSAFRRYSGICYVGRWCLFSDSQDTPKQNQFRLYIRN
jgi:hypothetical protein